MFLIVGLGNPGPKYARNRHNIGFMAVDEIARQHGFGQEREKLQGLFREGRIETAQGSQKALVVKPQTFMNESGRCVGALSVFHKVPASKIIVFYDELDLAPGRMRAKQGGGAAGHNGIRSIIASAVGSNFRRVRLGIGHPGREKVLSYVLDDFSSVEFEWVDRLCAAVGRHVGLLVEGRDDAFQTEVSKDAPAPPIPAWLRGGKDAGEGV